MGDSGNSREPLLKAGRRYRVLQAIGSLKPGQELNLLRADYSYIPYHDRGGWHLRFADTQLPLEQTEDADIIGSIGNYFLDVGPFDWQSEAATYAEIILETHSSIASDSDQEPVRRLLCQEIEAVLRNQPKSPDPMSPRKAYLLAVKRLRARGESIP